MPKISFNAEDLWIIRGSRASGVRYFQCITMWSERPSKATMFHDWEIAARTMSIAHEFRLDNELLDIVPLYTCLTYGGVTR